MVRYCFNSLCDISTISELFGSSEKTNNLYAFEVYSIWSLELFSFLKDEQSTGHFYLNLYSLGFKQKNAHKQTNTE